MTYEQLVEKCKELRLRAERSEAEFFIFLMMAEVDHADIWREAGCSDFDQFLYSNHLCKPSRYRLFVAGCNHTGVDAARTNGAAWTIEAGRMRQPTPEILEEFNNRAQAFVETTGTAPSEETSANWRRELDKPSADEHSTIRKASELHRLRAENAQLRADLASAKKRIGELEAKLATRGTRKTNGKHSQSPAA